MTTGMHTPQAERVGYAAITRVDAARREVEVTATSEALDAFGTIFSYEASCEAFRRWLGNVREMHANVAVGRRVAVECDDATRQIRVRLRISRGAESTWRKILDGTLGGASIGAANVTWREMPRGEALAGKPRGERTSGDVVRVATGYDLVELSLVDSPANPDCIGVAVIRAALPDPDMLDDLDDATSEPDAASAPEKGMDGIHAGVRVLLLACACDLCQVMLAVLDGESAGHTAASAREARAVLAEARRAATGIALLRGDLRVMTGQHTTDLHDLRMRLEALERQPAAGGPVLRAAEKTLGGPAGAGTNLAERIAALQEFGATLGDQHSQVQIASEILRLQRQGDGN